MNERKSHILHLVTGLPGSGKTTVARQLAVKHSACFFDSDQVSERLIRAGMKAAGMNPDDRDSLEYKGIFRIPVYETLFDLAAENLAFGDVVLAGPFSSEIQKEEFATDLSQRIGNEVVIYFVRCSAETRKKRMLERAERRDVAKLDDWENYLSTVNEDPPRCHHLLIENDADSNSSWWRRGSLP